MDVSAVLRDLGGVARRGALLRAVDRGDLERALAAGVIVRDGRGLYVVPGVDEGSRVAARLGGALCLTSAALRHGWAVKTVPDKPHVLVSRGRRLPADAGRLAWVHVGDPPRERLRGGVTDEALTLEHCLRRLPYDQALAVADSALRTGFGRQALLALRDGAAGPGAPRIRAVCDRADARAANPFESVLRAITHGVPGLDVTPQLQIVDGAFAARPDLVAERLRLVLEADSFEWHGKRSALASDARRYNALVVRGWIVLRFCYEDVMFRADQVRPVLVAAVALAEMLTEVRRPSSDAA